MTAFCCQFKIYILSYNTPATLMFSRVCGKFNYKRAVISRRFYLICQIFLFYFNPIAYIMYRCSVYYIWYFRLHLIYVYFKPRTTLRTCTQDFCFFPRLIHFSPHYFYYNNIFLAIKSLSGMGHCCWYILYTF